MGKRWLYDGSSTEYGVFAEHDGQTSQKPVLISSVMY